MLPACLADILAPHSHGIRSLIVEVSPVPAREIGRAKKGVSQECISKFIEY